MEQFRCVKKCYFNERRWQPDEVFMFIPGERDPNGKPLRTPEQAGVGKCFEPVSKSQAVEALARREQTVTRSKSPGFRQRVPTIPVDLKEELDTHD